MSFFFNFVRTSLLRSKKLYFFSRISKNVTFWLFLLKKIHIRKTSIFWRKQWTNPFPKCRYFLTLLELYFSSVNSILLFYPEYKEMFLSGLFCSKKKHLKKGRFFDKNHGLTSLRNVDFWEISRISLLRLQKLYFLSRISKNVSFWLFLLKEIHIRKRSIFWQKPWTYPFGKCRFFSTMWELPTFEVQKTLFSIQNIKKCFFHAFLLKRTHKQKVHFLRKTMD